MDAPSEELCYFITSSGYVMPCPCMDDLRTLVRLAAGGDLFVRLTSPPPTAGVLVRDLNEFSKDTAQINWLDLRRTDLMDLANQLDDWVSTLPPRTRLRIVTPENDPGVYAIAHLAAKTSKWRISSADLRDMPESAEGDAIAVPAVGAPEASGMAAVVTPEPLPAAGEHELNIQAATAAIAEQGAQR